MPASKPNTNLLAAQIRNRKAVILIPRVSGQIASDIAASVGIARARSEIRSAMRAGAEPLKSQLVKHSLHDLGATPKTWAARAEIAAQGTFRELRGLGAYTIEFQDPQQRLDVEDMLDGVRGELAYKVVDDFALGVPAPFRKASGQDSLSRTAAAEWAAESGVHAAHLAGIRGQRSMIGMLDTGIDADHEEFRSRTIDFRYVPFHHDQASRVVRGFDTNGHGSHVASVLCGERLGVAPACDLFAGSVIESESVATSALRVTRGLDWLVNVFDERSNSGKARIINLSLGFDREMVREESSRSIEPRLQGHMDAMRIIVDQAAIAGEAHVFAAIGNKGMKKASYPALFANVLAVGSVDPNGRASKFSGSLAVPDGKPDFFGPGREIIGAIERDAVGASWYVRLSGTSMATPFVAGVAALYLTHNPRLTTLELADVLRHTGSGVDGFGGKLVRYDERVARQLGAVS